MRIRHIFGFVRKDAKCVVLTADLDQIGLKDLANALTAEYGENQFRATILRDVCLIYVDINAVGSRFDSFPEVKISDQEKDGESMLEPDSSQRSLDREMALKVLERVRRERNTMLLKRVEKKQLKLGSSQ